MKSRVLIIGLDSATFDVIDELMESSELPNFSKICHGGVRAEMISTYPPRTAPGWVTLMTGQNPGRHGIFDFWFRKVNGYDTVLDRLVTSANYAGNTFFDILSKSNKHVGSLFVPMTFPTWEINGEMVVGPPLAPDTDAALSYPPGFHKELGIEQNIHLFPPSIEKGVARDETINDLLRMEEARADVALKLWKSGDYDCLMFVLESIDIVQHNIWRFFEDEAQNEFKETIPAFYRKADSIIGEILNILEEDDILFVVSDHGMTSHPKICFNTNAWLANNGWLSVSKNRASMTRLVRNGRDILHTMLPERFYIWLKEKIKSNESSITKGVRMGDQGTLAIEWVKTSAYRVPMQDPPLEGIMLNIVGRQPEGFVSDDSAEKICLQIKEELLNLKDPSNGISIVKAVHKRDELYQGPMANEMPDLIIEFVDGYKADSGLLTDYFTPTSRIDILRLSGTHALNGIFMAFGKPFANGKSIKPISIQDFAPTLLFSMNQPIPSFMDGKIQTELFHQKFLECNKVNIQDMNLDKRQDGFNYTPDDVASIEKKLKGLGYL